MLREILTTGYIDKNIQKKMISPGRGLEIKSRKDQDPINYTSQKMDIYNNTKPIMENKIDIIKNRPDYLINTNNESTFPTTTKNKTYIYNNDIVGNDMSPNNMNNINLNLNEIYSNINKEQNSNNANKNEDNSNININNIKNLTNNIKEVKLINENNKNEITIPDTSKNINSNDTNNANNNQSNSKTKNSKSFELNMSLLSSEGIDKIKLLEEYIAQIKENSTNINEVKIQQLQKQKDKLENKVNILSNNIRLNKKKYKDNIKNKKNLEIEKEKVVYDTNKANKDAFSLMKELPNNRVEIEIMKNQIAQAREETKYINNYSIEIDRQTMEIQDEIKKINVKISNVIKEKDKIQNEINYIQKKCVSLRSKIDKAEKSANEFLYNVGQLARLTQNNKI
jgi:chromosome segregation ATPase